MPFYLRCAALVAVAGLYACSASGAPPVNTLGSSGDLRVAGHMIRFGDRTRPDPSRRGWISPAAKHGAVIYGSSYDGGYINIYPLKGTNQAPIGQITAPSPQGLAVDKHHHLWVADTNSFNVLGFKRGKTTAFTTLDDSGYYPISVAVDSHGTVFAANAESTTGPPGNVTFWTKGSTTPSGTLTYTNFLLVTNIGIDSKDNVYVSYVPRSGPPTVVEFPAGSTSGQPIGIQDATLGDITFDKSQNLVTETIYNTLGVWAPPYDSTPTRTISAFGNEPTFDKNGKTVWIAYANYSNPMIEGYDYKAGTHVDTITNGWEQTAIPYGVAIDPPARL